MLLRAFLVEEQARGLDHHVGADIAPLEVGGVALLRQADLLAVDDEGAALDADLAALEVAVHRVVLEHVGEVVGLQKVVDADDLDVGGEVLDGGAKDVAADAAEAVDTHFDGHESSRMRRPARAAAAVWPPTPPAEGRIL